jgi:lipopolysaccharide export system protein LptA
LWRVTQDSIPSRCCRPFRRLGWYLLALAIPTLLQSAEQAMAQTQELPPSPQSAAVTPVAALATSGLVSIESDQQQADNATGVITASGNVRIVYPDRRVVATARQAQYFSRESRIVLSGDVDVIQADGSAMRAERVTVLLNSQRVLAQPRQGQQVVSTLRLDGVTTGPEQR